MNFIFGSANGIGNSLYKIYKENNLPVYGFDKISSNETDQIINLSDINNFDGVLDLLNNTDIHSITYCAGIQNQTTDESIFNVNVLAFIQIISNIFPKLNNAVICGISSIHSVASNKDNQLYAASKAALESAIKSFSISGSNSYFYFLRLGATETNLLLENVKDVEGLKNSLPSKKLFMPDDVGELIFDVNQNHKNLFNGGYVQIDQGVLSELSTE